MITARKRKNIYIFLSPNMSYNKESESKQPKDLCLDSTQLYDIAKDALGAYAFSKTRGKRKKSINIYICVFSKLDMSISRGLRSRPRRRTLAVMRSMSSDNCSET